MPRLLLALASLVTVVPAAAQAPLLILESPSAGGGGSFGFAVAVVPDADGDGVADLVVGSPKEDVGPVLNAGRAHLISGATGAALRSVSYPGTVSNSFYASEVAGLPDVDGDGLGDFAVGGNWAVYVYSGASGALLYRQLTHVPGLQIGFGDALAGVPDLNGDGRGDLLVGAPRHDVGAAQTGAAYLLSGASGEVVFTLVPPVVNPNGYFGTSVATVPDTDGDGVVDLLVGARNERVGDLTPGQAHLYSGATGSLLLTVTSAFPDGTGDFGSAVAGVPDVDGDGRGDLLVGAHPEDPEDVANAGRAYLFSGATGALLRTLVSPAPDFLGNFGRSVAGVADLDGDGRGDLLIGAHGEDGGATNSGRAYLFSGSSGTLLEAYQSPTPSSLPNSANQGFGYDVAGVPDVNGDGRGDALVGAPLDRGGPGGAPEGRVYLFAGGLATATPEAPVVSRDALSAAPNPARSAVTLTYVLDRPAPVRLTVTDALGREVALVVGGDLPAGRGAATLDVARLAPGLYLARLTTPSGTATARLVVVR